MNDAARWSEIVFVAVPFAAIDDVVKTAAAAFEDKTVVDVTNALDANMNLALGFTTSGAEELQKAFNTVFAAHIETGRVGGQALTTFVASDDAAAKGAVLELARDIGFDPVDAGALKNARHLEPMALLNIQLAFVLGWGAAVRSQGRTRVRLSAVCCELTGAW